MGPPLEADPFTGTPYRSVRRLRSRPATEIRLIESSDGRHHIAKILRPECVPMLQLVERLRLEGDVLAALHSPRIVRLHDRGRTPDGVPYLVLEQLSGRTLRREIQRAGGSLPPATAVELVIQLLEGARAFHEIGVIHRDLKPDNLFFCRKGELKILDFGYAKVREPSGPASVAPLAIDTDEREFVGAYRYVAPEQILRGKPLDHRADLYVIGLVLHALLTGREPFHDVKSRAELLRAQIEEMLYPPSPETADRVPVELFGVVRRATYKDAGARYQTADEFARDLRIFLARPAASSESARKRPSVQEHAEMTAAIELDPSRADEIRLRYGIASPAEREAMETWFHGHIENDASAHEKWRALVDIHRARRRGAEPRRLDTPGR